MTWKSHCLANGAVALALTGHLEVAGAAMLTAILPDQIEALLPFGKHRGASHWLALWLALMIVVPVVLDGGCFVRLNPDLTRRAHRGCLGHLVTGTLVYGMALGPFLHVLLDGCSDSGVPVAPFSRRKLKLGMYRTYHRRWRWDCSELLFLAGVIALCALTWRIREWFPSVY